jgi:hypothetical protein
MSYLKNTDVSSKYKVSSTTVLNWISAAITKNNNLQLELVGKKYKIIDNAHNRSVLKNLSNTADIYKNKIPKKITEINPRLYEILTEEQLVETINKIELNKLIPLKFTYLGEGADHWDEFIKNSEIAGGYLTINQEPFLLKKILPLILERIPKGKKINIVDVGAGNSASMLEIARYFWNKQILKSYIGIDISSKILETSKNNVLKIDKNIIYISHVSDFERIDFAKFLFDQKDENVINILFYVGNTLGNNENILRTLENFKYSLGQQDLLIITNKIDSLEMRTQFEPVHRNSPHIWLTNYLGIDTDLCELMTIYDEKTEQRRGYFRLDKDYEIIFKFKNSQKIIKLFKDDELIFWYHRMSERNKLFTQFSSVGLTLLDFTTTNDLKFLLAVCQADR